MRLVVAAGRAPATSRVPNEPRLGAHASAVSGPLPARVMMLMTPPTALEP